MKSISTIFVLLFTFFHTLSSQVINKCHTNEYLLSKAENNPAYYNRVVDIQNQIAQFATNTDNRASDDILRIPVVVHVIYKTEAQNISDNQIHAQIDRLNADYRRLNSDANLTRDEFLNVAADTKIEFFLSPWDPQGDGTNGITRTLTSQTSFWLSMTDMKSTATGGKDAWDVNHFLNIWVCNMAIPIVNLPLVLGFATPPEGAPNWPSGNAAETPAQDGVVIHYEVFGPNPSLSGTLASVNQGRTATHEIGHYLGLRHIWGDGDCSQDDGLSDTPSASAANQQTCDYSVNSCSDPSSDLPDMLENYMDYSDENCMNIFTQQQANAMRFVLENYRFNLLLSSIDINSKVNSNAISMFPNPANDFVTIKAINNTVSIIDIDVFDLSGRKISGNSSYNALKIDVSDYVPGAYLMHIHTNKGLIVNKFIKQ